MVLLSALALLPFSIFTTVIWLHLKSSGKRVVSLLMDLGQEPNGTPVVFSVNKTLLLCACVKDDMVACVELSCISSIKKIGEYITVLLGLPSSNVEGFSRCCFIPTAQGGGHFTCLLVYRPILKNDTLMCFIIPF